MARQKVSEAYGPPLTTEELSGSLSMIEKRLNGQMKCPAGKNQVYIRSLLTGRSTTKPRIALKCPLRKDIGQIPEVFFEHIRDVCCNNPESCEAWQKMKSRYTET